ncbi:unnamed protein product [Enterobius vermicularis]|uniref:Disintegrin domain-containing protein n=1 Tax=Enterobius vermicularis TaxID=51028 RepID=A0A0N4V5B1_ENTVE|nr:unnamed protein product [Enterobius vermicularis]
MPWPTIREQEEVAVVQIRLLIAFSSSCNSTELNFQCGTSGRCISEKFKCDGENHCPGNEDELECDGKCQNGAVWCKDSQKCLPKWKLCNGVHDCSDGSDEQNCTCNECCGKDRVLCPKTKACIQRVQLCDGFKDCSDGADEENCTTTCNADSIPKSDLVYCADGRPYQKKLACAGRIAVCSSSCDECDNVHAVSCKDEKKCLPKSMACDGRKDCIYGTDEENCHMSGVFSCVVGTFYEKRKFLKQDQICDGVEDCPDGSDEKGCISCRNNALLCSTKQVCIPFYKVCNGVADCEDSSDENNCTCTGLRLITLLSTITNTACFETFHCTSAKNQTDV